MRNKRDQAENGRDMSAEVVASRQGIPVEQAKAAVEKGGSSEEKAEREATDRNAQNADGRKF